MSLEEKEQAVKENPDYGEVICRCETVTRAEILQAVHNPLGVCTVTGIKNRTRATMGRCQGGYCETRITDLIQKEIGISEDQIRYSRKIRICLRERSGMKNETGRRSDHSAAVRQGLRQP